MKKLLFFLFAIPILAFIACEDDEEIIDPFQYKIDIVSPSTEDKHVGDTVQLNVVFSSEVGETVHHVKVRIVSIDGANEIFNQPNPAHVHATEGSFEFDELFILSEVNGVDAHTDWILEASVWPMGTTDFQVVDSIQFHVHPE